MSNQEHIEKLHNIFAEEFDVLEPAIVEDRDAYIMRRVRYRLQLETELQDCIADENIIPLRRSA